MQRLCVAYVDNHSNEEINEKEMPYQNEDDGEEFTASKAQSCQPSLDLCPAIHLKVRTDESVQQ